MKKVEIESKILNKAKMIEKIERRIQKHQDSKNEKQFWKDFGCYVCAGRTKEDVYRLFYQDFLDGCDAEIRRAYRDLEEARATLAKYYEMLRKAEADESLPEIKVLREFLDQWEAKCIAFHNDEVKNYIKDYTDHENGTFSKWSEGQHEMYLKFAPQYSSNKEYHAFRKWLINNYSKFTMAHTDWKNGCLDQEAIDEIAKEKERKYVKLLREVLAITGDITDAKGLRIGAEGDINGVVVGEKGKASVNTFGAGGWNIQIFHYRTKVTEIK